MKIGFLHSIKLNLGNIANAKMYRIHYDDWKYSPHIWFNHYYGRWSNRSVLRGLIYNHRSYYEEFQDFGEYNLIALSLNFDNYQPDFQKFVTSVINDLYRNFPILHQKEVIIMAGNEVFEKRRSAEKVFETCFDTKKGIEKSIKPNLPVCFWNQGINSEGGKAVKKLANSSLMQSICKYFGYQSLGTTPERMKEYIPFVQSKGFEVVDVECGTLTDNYLKIEELFDIDRTYGIKKVFLMCPYVSRELASYDENFKKYALSINGYKKDKFKIIEYANQFKDKKEEVFNKMWDDILFNLLYVKGTIGIGVKRIQRVINTWIKHHDIKRYDIKEVVLLDEDGKYGSKTEQAVKMYQDLMEVAGGIDGKAGTKTLTSMMNFMLRRYDK